MPWWGWVLAVPGVLAGLLWLARRSFRAEVRREVVEELRQAYRDLEVVEERADRLVVKSVAVGEVRIHLINLYREAARAGASPEARLGAVRRFLSGLHRQAAETGPLRLDRHGDRLLPRLVPLSLVRSAPEPTLPHRLVGDTGLAVAYVLDQPTSVAYLHGAQLKDLGWDEPRLHAHTMANLERGFSGAAVEEALAGRPALLQSGDSHDATRLLLVPGRLREGQVLAALAPDADTLALLPAPADGNWKALARFAKAGRGKPVLPGVPLRVTREGIARAPGC
jgi:hypothetical protein